jgi:hypothetical protein
MNVAVAVAGWLTCIGSPWDTRAADASYDLARVKDGLLRSQQHLRNVRVVYRFFYDVTPDFKVGGNRYVRLELAFGEPSSYLMDFSHGTDDLDWQRDPTRTRAYVLGRRYVIEWPNARYFEEQRLVTGQELSRHFSNNPFIVATGWWPPQSAWPVPHLRPDVPFGLVDVARSDTYSLSDREDFVDGRWCHVLESPGHDRIWLDCRQGFVVARRELLDPSSGASSAVYHLEDYRQVAEGAWLPARIRAIRYQPHSRHADEHDIIGRSVGLASELHANDLTHDSVSFDPLPGTLQMYREKLDCVQVRPGGLDYLDALGSQANATATRRRKAVASSAAPSRYEWLAAVATAGAIVGGFEAVCRRRRYPGNSI